LSKEFSTEIVDRRRKTAKPRETPGGAAAFAPPAPAHGQAKKAAPGLLYF